MYHSGSKFQSAVSFFGGGGILLKEKQASKRHILQHLGFSAPFIDDFCICDTMWEIIYTKLENLFLRSNLKFLGQKIIILSFEWKCVKVIPNNIFAKVLY